MVQLRILLFLFILNFSFFQSLSAIEISDWSYDKSYHHVENCSVCHDFSKLSNDLTSPPQDATSNYRGIRNIIQTPHSGFKEVVFRDRSHTDGDIADFADGDAIFNGICEVCHTQNNHHNNDGHDNTEHFDGKRCTACHLHDNAFAPPVEQAHRTHLDYRGRGPLIPDCTICHEPPINTDPNYQFKNDESYPILFLDGQELNTTTACNNCHGPTGPYPGELGLLDPVIGAKANFRSGIYKADGWLKKGKEKWCATCHDEVQIASSVYDPPPPPPTPPNYFEVLADQALTNMTLVGSGWDATITDHNGAYEYWKSTQYGVPAKVTYTFNTPVTGTYTIFMKYGSLNSRGTPVQAIVLSGTDNNNTDSQTFVQDTGVGPTFISSVEQFTYFAYAGPTTLSMETTGGWHYLGAGTLEVVWDPAAVKDNAYAPAVLGDNETYGFFATGHGVSKMHCTECHDPRKKHIDHKYRTHEIDETDNNKIIAGWGDSYRLQSSELTAGDALCIRCHDLRPFRSIRSYDGYTSQTNFRSDSSPNNHSKHYYEVGVTAGAGDSDLDGIIDSKIMCTNCHNVHGSYRPRMFRDGRLAGIYGSTSKMPAFMMEHNISAKAKWTPDLLGGEYEVFARWPAGATSTNAPYTVKSAEINTTTIPINQSLNPDTWISLGTYSFNPGIGGYVLLNNKGSNAPVVADAVWFHSASEDIILDNGDPSYTTYTTNNILTTTSAGYNSDYDTITLNDWAYDENATRGETQGWRVLHGTGMGYAIAENGLCAAYCHSKGDDGIDDDVDVFERTRLNTPTFLGPKMLNRFEQDRWVPIDNTTDANITITARDYDGSITSVIIDLSPIGGIANQPMTRIDAQTYSWIIPATAIAAWGDDYSHRFHITITDNDGLSADYYSHIFPTNPNTIYMDTNQFQATLMRSWNLNGEALTNAIGEVYPRSLVPKYGPAYKITRELYDTSYGIWQPNILESGKYKVYGLWNSYGQEVKYTIHAANGTFEKIIDQSTTPEGQWNEIGTYNFIEGNSGYIHQISNTADAPMVADAMKFVRVNSEPLLRISALQHNKPVRIIDNNGSAVTVSAIARDYDDGDTPDSFTYDWSQTDTAILDAMIDDYTNSYNSASWYNSKITFFPDGFAPGIYTIKVTVTDLGGLSVTNTLQLQVPDVYPVLGAVDTDGDGINDDVEGYYDLDEDGIPNYLDNNSLNNEIASGTSVITTQEGLELNIGTTAFSVGSDDGVVSATELTDSGEGGVNAVFDGVSSVGGLFDFDILGLGSVGQSVKVAFLLQDGATIPAGAVYKKYDGTSWQDFVIDTDNSVESASSVAGVCPTPGSSSYTTGLTTGDDCIQLTIQDGGPNDADGLANAEVKDPGGVFADYIVVQSSGSSGGWGSSNILSLFFLGMFSLVSLLYRRR